MSTEEPRRFDLVGALPGPGTTTVLEASAGTGKTFATGFAARSPTPSRRSTAASPSARTRCSRTC